MNANQAIKDLFSILPKSADGLRAGESFGALVAIKLLLIIGIIEGLIMVGLPYLSLPAWADAVLDTSLLTALSGVCIWQVIIKPERRRLQTVQVEALSFLRQKFEAIDSFAIVSMTDLAGKITYANPNFCKIAGYSDTELVGQSHNIINSGVHTKEFFNDIWQTISAGKIWRGQICNKAKDGRLYWVDSNIIPILDSDGKLTRYFSFRFDITAEKNAEKALEEERAKNIHLARLSSLGEMAGGIAHEINNPLAIISGQLAIVGRKIKSLEQNEVVSSIVETIDKSQGHVFRITRIINGLREFARSEDEQTDEFVSIKTIFSAVEGLCFEKIRNTGVEFSFRSIDCEINCNPIQIEQVLVNLINNSVDAIKNFPDKWIVVEAVAKGDFVEFSVTDSGRGIPDEIAKKIMQPFFTTKELGQGTGLGLSISHGITRKYGGSLELDTSSSNTRFVFTLPLNTLALMSLLSIDDAIKNHLAWKKRTLDALAESSQPLDEKKISADNLCALGQWIERIAIKFEKNIEFSELKKAHTEFHVCIGDLVRRANIKDPTLSEASMGSGSEFDNLSKRVIKALQQFRSSFETAVVKKAI